ncbi:MAG: hypothetical protein U1D41_15800 [Nitrosomonas sp.]|nr:hypothetical protein [Nitrosomonas sp.]MDP2224504.1 hypothetical protein [Nitrosomonas sp.]MDP3661861.1 hypothetical protein [Nitrosomonas sp.]MDZ4107588.1 hypothetical protein [Nitrosomonas sp.]
MCIHNTRKTEAAVLFPLGQIVATPGALEALDRAAINAADLMVFFDDVSR